MVPVAESDESPIATLMGLSRGMVVQELGWDEDVDEDLRTQIMDAIDDEMVEEAVEGVDAVVLWWREDDGDVVDGFVDSLTDLSSTGVIWLLTPKVGRPGHLPARDVAEAASTAGLSLTSPVDVSKQWQAQKVVRPKGGRR